ncbi:acetylcholinesterase-like isoform 2-T2 [Xenentodon cancila]
MATDYQCTYFALFIVSFQFLAASFVTRDDLIVSTKQGKVQGKLLSVLDGEVRAFLGIPYAKPPLEKLRFKAPEPVEKWEGVKVATKHPNSCHQVIDTAFPGFIGAEMWNPKTPLSEDCLYLNVWSPVYNKTQLSASPVLVWIYGGGFVSGTASLDIYQGHFLSKSEGVVVVSMNYRSLKLATLLGCPTSDQARLEICLQKADPKTIATKQYDVLTEPSLLALPFGPVVDSDFLPAKIEVLLHTSNLPKKELLIGLNKDEGTYFLPYGVPGFGLTGQSLITRNQFLYGVGLTMTSASNVAKEAAIFQYTDWTDEESRMKNRDSLGSLVGDQMFSCPVLEFAQRYSKNGGRTFLYFFDHRSSINPWPTWMGVMHGYEIEFVFGMPLNTSLGYTKNEVNMTKKFMKHWANFARTGNPEIVGASWPTFTAEKQEYVTLNYNHPEKMMMIKTKECQLWNKLLPQIQNISDDLVSCLNGSGITPHCNYLVLLILLVVSLF